jgi:hypothetical protein
MTQTDLLDLPKPTAPEPIVYPIQAAYVEHWNIAGGHSANGSPTGSTPTRL